MACRRTLIIALLCIAIVSCSGEKPVPGRETHPRPSPPKSASSSPAALLVGKVAPPPVRLFAGVRSITGTPVRYCSQGRCVDRRLVPPRLAVDPGSVVTFATGRAPQRATLEIGGRRIALTGATLMAFPGRLPPGIVRMTLALAWPDAEGTWIFELAVKRR